LKNKSTKMFLQLYFRGRGTNIRNRYGPGTGPILMDDLRCVGNETSIAECRHRGWYSHNCNHREDVSVSCDTSSGSGPSGMWHYAYYFYPHDSVLYDHVPLCQGSFTPNAVRCVSAFVLHVASFLSYTARSRAATIRTTPHCSARSAPHTVWTILHKPAFLSKLLKRLSCFWHDGFQPVLIV